MKFTLVRPCAECPFRNDRPGYLTIDRAEEIADALTTRQGTFSCHKTNVEDDYGEMIETEESQHCAGAMIMLEKMEQPNQMMRICERIGLYDMRKLDMDSPVVDDVEEFVEIHSQ